MIGLIISITINILFALLLLFRSALNDILKEWWSEKRKARKESRDRLVAVRSSLLKLSNAASLLLILTATKRIETDPVLQEQLKRHWDGTAKSYGEIREAIVKDEPLLPSNAKQAYKDFETEMQAATKEVLNSVMYKERLLEITQSVTSKIEAIIQSVDEHLP